MSVLLGLSIAINASIAATDIFAPNRLVRLPGLAIGRPMAFARG